MKLEELRGKLSYQGILLGGVALLTSGALAIAAHLTAADIKAAETADLKQSLTQVLPGEYDNDLLKDTVTLPGKDGDVLVYRARRQGKVEAVVYRMIGHGYAGALVCVMGVSREGRILGVRVIKHAETPGLGDKIDPAKSNWIHSFEGKWLGDPVPDKWAVKKDGGVFDQFAGATITPRGVVKAVKEGLEFFDANRTALLDGATVEGIKP
ncbi:electron transport complex subunit RsxG [Sideroxydans lithotrophicus]|uniref:Ion-translocating oxidoreductase complex subunit G n=1 Tax=Sideroxydans lithotrophicus (strain ES-1) TaxID=580332 RepID=D5CPF9_SIDLE|nr:electron transport complex subunit RsxG [Sideroxydans lithotrophicus]ADE11100.1 electron transport complex, RnfABCDGE type, G subunit [Sideroxydans lithotrophicus ES-1]